MTMWTTHVFPHGPIEELAPGLWQVTGSLKRSPLPRNMIIWRTPDHSLLIHSAICLQEESMKQLEALGEISHIVIPCEMHRADAAPYQQRYPQATFLAPVCAHEKVKQVVDHCQNLEDGLRHWGITVHRPAGLKDFELHLELPLENGYRALIMTDALFNLGPSPPTGFSGFVVKLLGSVGPLNITKIGKRLLLEDKEAFATYIENLATIPNLSILSVAHGTCIQHSVVEELIAASERIRK